MMYRTALLAATSLTMVACAKARFSSPMPNAVSAVEAADVYYKSTASTATYKEYLRFDEGALTKIVFCANGGARVRVEVTAPAKVMGQTLVILADTVQVDHAGDVPCVAKLDQGASTFRFDADETLSVTSQKSGWTQAYRRAGKKRPGVLAEMVTDANAAAASMRAKTKAEREVYERGLTAEAHANVQHVEAIVDGVKSFGQSVAKTVGKSIADAQTEPTLTPIY